MASFCLQVYFPFRYRPFTVGPQTLYNDLHETVFHYFNVEFNYDDVFLLQIYDIRYKRYVEFDDEYLNRLRKLLPRTSVASKLARIICRQQSYLFPQLSFFSVAQEHQFRCNPYKYSNVTNLLSPPYRIVWLDEHFGRLENFRSMKRYLYTATLLEGPIYDPFFHDVDIDNLIRNDNATDFDTSNLDSHLKLFTDADQCCHYINSRQENWILLITSDRNGRTILPLLYKRLFSTYILRNGWIDFEWGFDYIESLQMFDDDRCMLARIVRDLAQNLVDRALHAQPNEAFNYLTWAKKLYIQASRGMSYRSVYYRSATLDFINHQLDQLAVINSAPHLNESDEEE